MERQSRKKIENNLLKGIETNKEKCYIIVYSSSRIQHSPRTFPSSSLPMSKYLFLHHQNVVVYFRDNSFGSVQELFLHRVNIDNQGNSTLDDEDYHIGNNKEYGVGRNDWDLQNKLYEVEGVKTQELFL